MAKPANEFTLIEPAVPEALLPGSWTWVWLAVGLIVNAIIISIWWNTRRHRDSAPVSPHDNAMADALLALEKTPTTSARETATRVSLILRRFLAKTTSDPALFETHEEFVARHDALAALDEPTREHTASTFSRLASIKYAPDNATGAPAEIINDARSLLHSFTSPPTSTP